MKSNMIRLVIFLGCMFAWSFLDYIFDKSSSSEMKAIVAFFLTWSATVASKEQ